MPRGAEVLTVQMQREVLCVWAVVDPDAEKEQRKFIVYGTGHEYDSIKGEYVGTVQIHGGDLVWHVFAKFI